MKISNIVHKLAYGLLIIGVTLVISLISIRVVGPIFDKYKAQQLVKANQQQIEQLSQKISQQSKLDLNELFESSKTGDDNLDQLLIGYISISRINETIMLFSKCSNEVLQRGAGIVNDNFDITKNNTNTLIAGHSGLAQRSIFSKLGKIKKNDYFYITIGKDKYAYKVTNTRVVLPTDTSAFKVIPNQKTVTLVTCTPYLVNTHRLLVVGKQVGLSRLSQQQERRIARAQTNQVCLLILGIIGIALFRVLYKLKKK